MTDPILLDIPDSFETERLLLRIPRPGDGAALNQAVDETFEELHAWMPWAKDRQTVAQTEEFCRRAYSKYILREEFTFAFIHKPSGLFAGCVGLHPHRWVLPSFEIGYWCRRRFHRQGLTRQAVRCILEFGFEKLRARRIQVRCDARNEASAKLAESVEMKLEGILRNNDLAADGTIRSTKLFALTDEDWKTHV